MCDILAALFLFGAALWLRTYSLTRDALTLDEATSVWIAAKPLTELVAALTRDGNPPLYYVLLHGWMRVFGDSERSVRLLSALCGAAIVPALYVGARALAGRAAGGFAALLGLLSPLHVYYSQQVRMYSLLPLEAFAFVVTLMSACRSSGFIRWALVALIGAATIWTHNYGLFLIASSPAAWFALDRRKRSTAVPFVLSLLAIAVLYAPWAPVLMKQAGSGVGGFIAPLFARLNLVLAVPQALLNLLAGYCYPEYLYALGQAWCAPLLVVAWCLAAGAISVSAFRNEAVRPHLSALLFLTLGPLLLALLVSLIRAPVFLLGRYEMIVLPAFAVFLGIATGARSHPRSQFARVFMFLLIGGYVVLAAVSLPSYFSVPPNRTSERIATVLKRYGKPGDIVFTTGLVRSPVEYYLRQLHAPVTVKSYPSVIAEHPGWYDAQSFLTDQVGLRRDAAALIGSLAPDTTVFLVDHAASPLVSQVNAYLHQELAARAKSAPVPLYASGPDPRAAPTFLVVRYDF